MGNSFLRKLFPALRRKSFLAWQIEITTRCPLSCRMCIRQGLPEWEKADMSLSDFRKLVPYFNDVETVILQGWGEPLLHNDLIPFIGAAKGERPGRRSPSVGFVTSGKGLDARYSSELIDAGLDFIGFSFAGSSAETHEAIRVNSDFRELITAIHEFNELKQRKGTVQPRTHMVYLMLRDNLHDIPNLPRLARDIGIREIFLVNLIHATTPWQDSQRVFSCNDKVDAHDILSETEARAREVGVHLKFPSLTANETLLCDENPLRNVYISVTGDISPCVYLYPPSTPRFKRIFCGQEHEVRRVSFGNILKKDIGRIWDSTGYQEFRDQVRCRVQSAGKILFSSFLLADNEGRAATSPLQEPPVSCRTCHKMLGV